MGFWSKLILGGLGWTLGGPIGAIIGVVLGGLFTGASIKSIGGGDGFGSNDYSNLKSKKTTHGDFLIVLMILAGSVMKADGNVVRSELDAVKAFLRENFSEEEGKEALQILKKILDANYSYREVCMQVGAQLSYSARLELVHLLFKISSADGDICQAEVNVIYDMCHLMGVSDADYQSIKAAYRAYTGGGYNGNSGNQSSAAHSMTLKQAYSILELTESATDDEVKKAYRRMAMKYHPDKVNTLGEQVRQSATEKFKAVGEAYQMIKEQRGMK